MQVSSRIKCGPVLSSSAIPSTGIRCFLTSHSGCSSCLFLPSVRRIECCLGCELKNGPILSTNQSTGVRQRGQAHTGGRSGATERGWRVAQQHGRVWPSRVSAASVGERVRQASAAARTNAANAAARASMASKRALRREAARASSREAATARASRLPRRRRLAGRRATRAPAAARASSRGGRSQRTSAPGTGLT
jgi:hypothetical protein